MLHVDRTHVGAQGSHERGPRWLCPLSAPLNCDSRLFSAAFRDQTPQRVLAQCDGRKQDVLNTKTSM